MPSRRAALKILGTTAVAAGLPPAAAAQSDEPFDPAQRATLESIADVVLPAEVGDAARRDAVRGFVRWVRGYREGADMEHGYGHTRVRATGSSPARRYPAQFAALEKAARARGADAFASLPIDARRSIVEEAIAAASIERLPIRPDGGHLATDLMACYFRSATAANVCYRARIDRDSCRGLPGSEHAPAALATEAQNPESARADA
ncbi:MAG TPA: hypothetical protein VF159_11230 [Gemmatimonadaceae bacterium]